MSRFFVQTRAAAFYVAALSIILGCGGRKVDDPDNSFKAMSCQSVERGTSQEEVIYLGKAGQKRLHFSDIRSGTLSACKSCHQSPATAGNFSFIDKLNGEQQMVDGVSQFLPGHREIAERVVEVLRHSDETKRMPPLDIRKHNPGSYLELAKRIEFWIQAGKPDGGFSLGNQTPVDPNRQARTRRTELGDCIPKTTTIGFDFAKDREFSKRMTLPLDLADTDIFSLDAFELAQKGTVAYNVAYPLWADNADKGRWIHLPMKIENGALVRQNVTYDQTTHSFKIPENTRFYKTFYKKIKMPNGKPRFKRIETRIIVVRKPWDKSLFGTYKWDDYEQSATLIETPYRDGTPFKDTVFEIMVDEERKKPRGYAIPGSQRCIECHMGSTGQEFVLGFTPLQLNHRIMGEGGREKPLTNSELSQVARFVEYGMIQNAPPQPEWPKLEKLGGLPPQNEYELRAQGYFVGNCAHCHNPSGFAFTKENGITLNLSAGAIFGFSTHARSTQIPSRSIVHRDGDLDQSHVYRKVADSAQSLGMTSQMPMNTPGAPDCQVLRVVGKWVKSFESLAAAEAWEPNCKKESEFKWIDQDFTTAPASTYQPRRMDWYNPISGMPEKFRNLKASPSLITAITKEIPVGYWNAKPECKFPERTIPADEIKPWMMRGSQPKRPFGEIYFTTPGSWYFRTSCLKCHGVKADGVSALAKGILTWSGGDVQVANLIGGMFGNKSKNLETFTKDGENFASRYLIWMAMEGTRVTFPPELSGYLGRHGGQMLNAMREKCMAQISPIKASSPNFMDHEIFKQVCFVDNRQPGDPALGFDPNTGAPHNKAAVEEWADRGAYNIGFAIYEFLKEASEGNWRAGNDQCEQVHPAGGI